MSVWSSERRENKDERAQEQEDTDINIKMEMSMPMQSAFYKTNHFPHLSADVHASRFLVWLQGRKGLFLTVIRSQSSGE